MNTVGDYCHPNLRTSFKCTPVTETSNRNCIQNSAPCGDCCLCYEKRLARQECPGFTQQGKASNFTNDPKESNTYVQCVPYDFPRETGISCSEGNQKSWREENDLIKAERDYYSTREMAGCRCHKDVMIKGIDKPPERPCCSKKTSWTEPRICRCDPTDPESFKRCECECGATVRKPEKRDAQKSVRFADEVTYVDCDKAFQTLEQGDIKELCPCCKGCVNKGKDVCIGKPVMVYELPEPKFEDTSTTRRDYHWHKTPKREVPPWHPNLKDRWNYLEVPSLTETTYQCDFKPPPVALRRDRDPVYLAPQREKRDPCQQLAEEYCTWKKTTKGPQHVYHSSCDSCDKDLQRVHLHECDAAHLPPQYQCHGDGHLSDRVDQCDPHFTLCEAEDTGKSRYWWQRTCCLPEKVDVTKLQGIPADLKKPACPSYTTMYMSDYRNPKRVEKERLGTEYCSACEFCSRLPSEEVSVSLCTAVPNKPFLTQRGGIIGT